MNGPTLFDTGTPGLAAGIRAAAQAADHLTPADAGAVQLAVRLADDLDHCHDIPGAARLARTLLDCLRDLGLTPAGRGGIDQADQAHDPVAAALAVPLQLVE